VLALLKFRFEITVAPATQVLALIRCLPEMLPQLCGAAGSHFHETGNVLMERLHIERVAEGYGSAASTKLVRRPTVCF
jgi:hypothetical protein